MAGKAVIEAEKELARLIEEGDEARVQAWLDAGKSRAIEFTGRCLAAAITRGMASAACRMGELGFHLSVTDDEAACRAIEESDGMRGLLGFLSDYRYCKAQRSYYLQVAESPESREPVRRMMAKGLLSDEDATELLSLSLRTNRPELARVLAEGGASLISETADETPVESTSSHMNRRKSNKEHWADFATPQRSLETLELIFDHTEDVPCSIYRSWWGSYGRQEGFAAKVAAIALHSDDSHCDCTRQVLETLAQAGEQAGLEAVLAWDALDVEWLEAALVAAQNASKPQAAAAIMRTMSKTGNELDFLDF